MLRIAHFNCVALVVSLILLQTLYLVEFHSSWLTQRPVGSVNLNADLPRRVEEQSDPVPVEQSMSFVTLTYGRKSAQYSSNILHNCLMIKQAKGNNSYVIYTDQPKDKEYCKHCECKKFKFYNCKCPVNFGNCTGVKNACEKNHFFSDMMLRYPEVVYLDHDLLIVKPSFFEAFYPRTRHHDFLAARDQGRGELLNYRKDFNSGLVFIRRLPDVDPMLLRDYLYTKNTRNYDQPTLSTFVQLHYKNWDELSIKWHCRAMLHHHSDIPVEHCYTLHPPWDVLLDRLNFTRLKA